MAFKIKNFYGSPLYSSSPDRPFTAGDTERKEKKWHLLHVTCHFCPQPQPQSKDPTPANSTHMQSRLVCKDLQKDL